MNSRLSTSLSSWLALLLAVALGVVLATAWTGCAEDDPLAAPPDQSVPALVGIAQSYHEQADIAVENAQLDVALDAMRDLINTLASYEVPHRETLELGMDAYGRLARLHTAQGNDDAALSAVEEGLTFGSDAANDSLFAGYLWQMKGELLKNRGDDLGAVNAHKSAIVVFKAILTADSGGSP